MNQLNEIHFADKYILHSKNQMFNLINEGVSGTAIQHSTGYTLHTVCGWWGNFYHLKMRKTADTKSWHLSNVSALNHMLWSGFLFLGWWQITISPLFLPCLFFWFAPLVVVSQPRLLPGLGTCVLPIYTRVFSLMLCQIVFALSCRYSVALTFRWITWDSWLCSASDFCTNLFLALCKLPCQFSGFWIVDIRYLQFLNTTTI